MTYAPQRPDGTLDTPVTASFPQGFGAVSQRYTPPSTPRSNDIFVKFDGVKGDSKDHIHDEWSRANGTLLTVSGPTRSSNGNIPAGMAKFDPLTVEKVFDRSTPLLLNGMGSGKQYSSARVDVCTPLKNTCPLRINLTEAVVASFDQAATDHERIAITYGQIQVTYVDSSGKTTVFDWDLKRNN
jgi:type VI protein secretion system component Hcp